jgi:large subunit ribosomal protein L10
MNGGVPMPSEKVLSQKKEVVATLAQEFSSAKTMVLVDYRGLTVEQDTELRTAMRKAGVEYKVVKNTLAAFAMKENNVEGVDKFLKGPTAIAYSNTDLIAPAKVTSEFAKKFDKLEIKAGVIEGNLSSVNDINNLADLPPKEVLIARVLGGLNAPISGFANVLNANITGLVRVLNAISEKQ